MHNPSPSFLKSDAAVSTSKERWVINGYRKNTLEQLLAEGVTKTKPTDEGMKTRRLTDLCLLQASPLGCDVLGYVGV